MATGLDAFQIQRASPLLGPSASSLPPHGRVSTVRRSGGLDRRPRDGFHSTARWGWVEEGVRGREASSPPPTPPPHLQRVCAWVLVQDHTNLWFSSNFKRSAKPSLAFNFGATASFAVKNLGEVTFVK